MRDGKLCGYVFSQLGKGVTWGYMLPIEPVFDAIAKHWHHHYQRECYPEVAESSAISEIDSNLGPVENGRCSSTATEDDKCQSNDLLAPTKTAISLYNASADELAGQPSLSHSMHPSALFEAV